MNRKLSIRPSRDLRNNYSKVSALARQNPVAITVNGHEDVVVVCHDDYLDQLDYISQLEASLAVYDHFAQAADDIKLGRVQDAESAFGEIMAELDGIEL